MYLYYNAIQWSAFQNQLLSQNQLMLFPNSTEQKSINPFPDPINKDNQPMIKEEIQTTIHLLKRRFREGSADDIIASLTQHLQHKKQKQSKRLNQQPREQCLYKRVSNQLLEALNESTFEFEREIVDDSKNNKNGYHETDFDELRLENLLQTRIVALIFRTDGHNYATIRELLPNMSGRRYKDTIYKINRATFYSIQAFLKNECHLKILDITTEQERVIIKQLRKVRDWLGENSMGQLFTYYKFIERLYEQREVEVTHNQAMRIYKTLLKRVKNSRDEIQNEYRQNNYLRMSLSEMSMPGSACLQQTAVIEQYSKNELRYIVKVYLRHKSIQKASFQLQSVVSQQRIKWNKQSIICVLKYAIKKTVQRIKKFAQEQKFTQQTVLFGTSEWEINGLLQSPYFRKTLLMAYYHQAFSAKGLSGLIRTMKQYLNKGALVETNSLQIEIEDEEDFESQWPKLQVSEIAEKLEKINLEGDDGCGKMTEATSGKMKQQSAKKLHFRRNCRN